MERVVITGAGSVCALGVGMDAFHAGLAEGRTGLARVGSFDPSGHRHEMAFEASAFETRADHPEPRGIQLLECAAREALAQSGVATAGPRVGVSLGTSQGAMRQMEPVHRSFVRPTGPADDAARRSFEQNRPGYGADWLAGQLGATGQVQTFGMVCASSTMALLGAADLIREGQHDVIVAGGFEEFSAFIFTGFSIIGAMASGPCLPFDQRRDGTLTGEGAAILVLESESHARARGATILAEIAGGGFSADAVHMTAPDRHGGGVVRAIRMALREAGCSPAEVGYLNAHGTGTVFNDQMEARAFEQLFPEAIPPLSSLKAAIGHTMGAAGAFDALATLAAVERGLLAPTWGLEQPIEDLDWDFVRGAGRQLPEPVACAVTTNSAMAGNNVALVLRRYHPLEAR